MLLLGDHPFIARATVKVGSTASSLTNKTFINPVRSEDQRAKNEDQRSKMLPYQQSSMQTVKCIWKQDNLLFHWWVSGLEEWLYICLEREGGRQLLVL